MKIGSYLGGFLICWNVARVIVISNNLQSNDVAGNPTYKLSEFIYGELKQPIVRLLALLQRDSSLRGRKSSTTRSELRYPTTNSITCHPYSSLQCTSSHVLESCATVSIAPMVKVLFVHGVTPLLLQLHLSASLSRHTNHYHTLSMLTIFGRWR